ncbi:MAG: aconitate hydratase, partial [Propionibacteriaceae bacterium]|nr:aconitate hydratase [Propionibacteriaceae bacterium]
EYHWTTSSYIRRAPYFDDLPAQPSPPKDITDARILAVLGDSVTTDHISPAGSIKVDSPAGRYLAGLGVEPADFNSYGSRRGNHEVMMRGTFANTRLRNLMVAPAQGGLTRDLTQPDQPVVTIFAAAETYANRAIPLVVIAGKEYGSGSSRDWAAKGPALLGVRAVIAESYERIHRSNLIGMGILPLQFPAGESAATWGLTGQEVITISGLQDAEGPLPATLTVLVNGQPHQAVLRVDTPTEAHYIRHGGILPYQTRVLAGLV